MDKQCEHTLAWLSFLHVDRQFGLLFELCAMAAAPDLFAPTCLYSRQWLLPFFSVCFAMLLLSCNGIGLVWSMRRKGLALALSRILSFQFTRNLSRSYVRNFILYEDTIDNWRNVLVAVNEIRGILILWADVMYSLNRVRRLFMRTLRTLKYLVYMNVYLQFAKPKLSEWAIFCSSDLSSD